MAPIDETDIQQARTYQEAAQDLRASVRTVKRLVASGELTTIRVGVGRGGRAFIPRRSILEYLNRHHERLDLDDPPPDPKPRKPKGKGQP